MPMKLQRRRSFLPSLSINTIAIRDPDNHNTVKNKIHITEKSMEKGKKESRGEGHSTQEV